jgi:hypothetical protein
MGVPPWFECILLVGWPHCLIRRPSCPDTCSYHTVPDFPWTTPILLCCFSLCHKIRFRKSVFLFFLSDNNSQFITMCSNTIKSTLFVKTLCKIWIMFEVLWSHIQRQLAFGGICILQTNLNIISKWDLMKARKHLSVSVALQSTSH